MVGSKTLDAQQVEKAVAALLKFVGTQQEEKNDLLTSEEDVLLYLVIALKKVPQQPRKDKPIRIPIPHPIYTTENVEVCLFVKDHKGEGHKSAKSKVREERIAGISKVVGLSKLRTKYESHEAKRQLCASYDLFAADERVLPSLPKLLGKSFFKNKKQPVPVRLTGKDWAAQIRKACEATYLFWSGGNSLTIKVARSSQSQQQCVANALAAIAAAVEKVPRKWEGVQALFLKTADSVALPVYQVLPDAPNKIE